MKSQNKSFPLLLVVLIFSLGLIVFGVYNLNKMPASPYPNIHGIFSLHSVDGPVTSNDLLGKVGVIYFGYTHCPDTCPSTLLRIGVALKLLNPEDVLKVAPLFITTDPERDSPALMAKYARHFDSHILGLSGSSEEIKAATKSFLSGYKQEVPDKNGNYVVSHASYIIIVRPDGSIGELMPHNSRPEDIAATIRHWLRWT